MIHRNRVTTILLVATILLLVACSEGSRITHDAKEASLGNDGPAATLCKHHWPDLAVGWRTHIFTEDDCTNGLPVPGATGVGQNENGSGRSGDYHCWGVEGWHYNHPGWVGAQDGTVRCLYVPPPDQPQPNTAVTTCSVLFDHHIGWTPYHDWVEGDCSHGLPAPGSKIVGNAYTGSGLGGMADCNIYNVAHYNHPAYDGDTDALVTCTYLDPTPVDNPELTYCDYQWSTLASGWRAPHFWADDDCRPNGRPRANATAVGSSTSGSGQLQQASCTPTSGNVSTIDQTTATVHCLFQNVGTSCVPQTCQQQGFNCGLQDDGCGNLHDCGTCFAPLTCGATHTGVCGASTGGLQYFGYWRDNDLEGFMCEIQTHANYSMINPQDNGLAVGAAAGYGISVAVSGNDRPPSDEVLRSASFFWIADDAENAANSLCADPHSPCGGCAPASQCCWNCFKGQLENAAADIRQRAASLGNPNIRFAINLLGDFRGYFAQLPLPQGITEIAYECYGLPSWTPQQTVDNCSDMVSRTALRPGDRVWILPPGETGAGTESLLIQKGQALFNWMRTDSRIGGINVFWWNHGVRDLPTLKAFYTQIGTAITGRMRPVPDGCPPPP